jgi:CheY-like chemotaxis protein
MEAIGQLTGGIAHDFNNLLTAVIGNLSLIKGRLSADPKLHRMADSALQAATRGAQLTSQLLSFARRQTMHPAPADAGALVAQMSGLLRRAAGEAIDIETLVPAELWPCRLDAAQFESALLNLVINARDAMPKGGRVAIRIANAVIGAEDCRALDLKAPGDYIRVSVTDTGSGIDEATLARVFEPFFTTKEIGKGSGLGLPMVHGFAAQSGGTVAIDSALGRGTTVSIYLPRCAERPAAADEEKDDGPEIILPGRTILVLEDEPEVLEIARSVLEAAGCAVITARDGEEALEALRGPDRIDALFADIVLPNGMNGIETAQVAHRIRPGLNVLLTSGYAEEILSRSGVKSDNLLRKPYLPKDLVKRIAALVATPPAAKGPWAA